MKLETPALHGNPLQADDAQVKVLTGNVELVDEPKSSEGEKTALDHLKDVLYFRFLHETPQSEGVLRKDHRNAQ